MSTLDLHAALKLASDPAHQFQIGELAAALLLACDALTTISSGRNILGSQSKQTAIDALAAVAELQGTDRDRLRNLADQFFNFRTNGDVTRPFLDVQR